MITFLPLLFVLLGCPDPPAEIAALQDRTDDQGDGGGRVGPGGDPDRMDLSPGGTVLLDMDKVVVQQSQADLMASGTETVSISGELHGDCTGGTLRIDIIELEVEQTPTGPMLGPVTALYPTSAGPFTVLVPKGKNVQVAAICDIDKDNQIVQDTDKLAPGVALGVLSEDKDGLVLAFPGERQAVVPEDEAGTQPGATPPGDVTASNPSAGLSETDE